LQIDDLGIDYMQRRAGYINAVTLDQDKAAARKLLAAEPTIMVVGPPLAGAGKG
jgi:zinc protease